MPSERGAVRCLVVSNLTRHSSIDTMMYDLARALSDAGVHTQFYMANPQAPDGAFLGRMLADLRDFPGDKLVVDGNGAVMPQDDDGAPLLDRWGIPRMSFMMDHPIVFFDRLAGGPQGTVLGLSGPQHGVAATDWGLPHRGLADLPHGGPKPVDWTRPTRDRPIDVLFVGGIDVARPVADWAAALSDDAGHRRMLTDLLDGLLTGEGDLYLALRAACAARGIDGSGPLLSGLYRAIGRQARAMRRRQVLQSIRRARVTLVSGEVAAGALDGIDADRIDTALFPDVLDLMARAKTVLHLLPAYNDAGHDRVFYGLSRGAMILSHVNAFLRPEVDGRLGVRFLPQTPGAIDDLVAATCANGAALDAERDRAVAHYARTHTWDARVAAVLPQAAPLLWPGSPRTFSAAG